MWRTFRRRRSADGRASMAQVHQRQKARFCAPCPLYFPKRALALYYTSGIGPYAMTDHAAAEKLVADAVTALILAQRAAVWREAEQIARGDHDYIEPGHSSDYFDGREDA